MKAPVINVVLVFLGGYVSYMGPNGRAVESLIKEYFG